jgi:hypothetical protein
MPNKCQNLFEDQVEGNDISLNVSRFSRSNIRRHERDIDY